MASNDGKAVTRLVMVSMAFMAFVCLFRFGLLPLLPRQCTMSIGRRAKNHFPLKFLRFAIAWPRPKTYPSPQREDRERERDRERDREATFRSNQGAGATVRHPGRQSPGIASNPPDNPFPPHKPQIHKDHSLALQIVGLFLLIA